MPHFLCFSKGNSCASAHGEDLNGYELFTTRKFAQAIEWPCKKLCREAAELEVPNLEQPDPCKAVLMIQSVQRMATMRIDSCNVDGTLLATIITERMAGK